MRRRRKKRPRNCRKLLTAEAFAELVALFAGHVEVKHEVFDVEPKLRQRLLHQGKNPASAADRVDDADIGRFQLCLKTGGSAAIERAKSTNSRGSSSGISSGNLECIGIL